MKAVTEALKAAKAAVKKNPTAQKALNLAQERVLALQSELLRVQEKALSLQTENAQLAEQNRKYMERASEHDKYEREKVGNALVMVRKGDPEGVYYCPTCFDQGKYLPLQEHPIPHFGSHLCSTCSTNFKLS